MSSLSWQEPHKKAQSWLLIGKVIAYLLLIFTAITMIFPFYWMIATSFKSEARVFAFPPDWIPNPAILTNYTYILTELPFARYTYNSAKISSLWTLGIILSSSLAAYAFARFNIPHKRGLLLTVLGAQLLPPISVIIPLFRMFKAAGLLDTISALVLAYSTFSIPFVVWIMASYFQSVPAELEEAARIDGASRFQAFLRIALPLAAPGLGATSMFTLLNAWDEFFFALIFTATYTSKTVPVALAEFIGRHSVNWGMLVTGGFIASLPPIVLSLVFYRYIVSGLAAGGVKG